VVLLAAAVFFSIAAGRADETNHYTGKIWAFEDSKPVMAAAAGITLQQYPDCDDATVEQRMVRVYRADGTGECQDETFTKILTEKGKRANRTLGLSFMLPYSHVEVAKLEVLRPGGEVVTVDVAANSKETIDDSQMSMNIYDPNSKVLQVNIPRLEIGDVLHAITRTTIDRPYIPGEYAEVNVFEGRGYIRHISYEVHAPADRPLKKIGLRAEIPGTVKSSTEPGENGGTIYHWEVNNVPRMFDEPGMPPYEMTLQRLCVSTLPDWPAVSKWYWNLSRPHLDATNAAMKIALDKVTANAKTPEEKTRAIFYDVSKNIRYMGRTPETDRPGFEPHDVCLTFDKKYGVCRDKAALLVAMLRAAGVNAYPVLISVGSRRDTDVPDSFFNHAIVGVETKPGQYLLMDPTDEHTRELLPYYDCDQSYLICRPEGEQLLTSPIESPDKHLMHVRTSGTLTADGRLDAKSELVFEGVNDDAYRNAFSHMKPDDERRFFERNLKQAMPGARLDSFKLFPTNMLDMSEPVRAELEYSADGITTSGNGKSVVEVPWIGDHFGVVNFILRDAGLDQRKYSMRTTITCGLTEEVAVKLGPGFNDALSMPSCKPIGDDCVEYGQRFNYADHRLECSRQLKLKVVEFSPGQYAMLKQTLKQMDYDARKTPVLAAEPAREKKPAHLAAAEAAVESDATILDSRKQLEVTDAHTAVYRIKYSKRILSYNGKKREAELKIGFNPSCQDAKLIRGTVVSRDGVHQEISKDEMSVMDAGWNASARRYTGGKILVANLPGVDIGSTIEVELEITSKGKPYISGFEQFQMVDELEHKSFEVTAPAGVNVRTLVTGPKGILKESSGKTGRQELAWESRHVKALPAEAQLPPDWVFAAGVEYFVGDVADYYRDVRNAMLDRSRQAEKAAALARELTAHAKTRTEAATIIRDFIIKTIRSAGPSFTDLPLTELSAADTTLADGYGHLADRAILFHAMLAAAGFKPQFVLASDLPPIKEINGVARSFPLPQVFDYPLVRIEVDGREIYLNDTDQYAQLGTTAHEGRLALSLDRQSYDVVKAAKDCEDKTDTAYAVSVGVDGRTRIAVTRRYYGPGYNRLNRYFSELPPEEKRRYYQELVSDMAQGARPTSDLTTKFDVYPGIEKYAVEIDNYGVVDGRFIYFDLPFAPSLFAAGADQRALPLFVSGESRRIVRAEVELPRGFSHVLLAPKSEQFETPQGSGRARITAKAGDGKFVITDEFDTASAIVKPKDYPKMLEAESALGKKAMRLFLLEKDLTAAATN
jgi:transglutaminase-like putative cysteine protease